MNPNRVRYDEEKSPKLQLRTQHQPPRLWFLTLGMLAWMSGFCGASAADGVYAGIGLGVSNVTVEKSGFEFKTEDVTATEATYRIFAGYGVGDHLRLEGGYLDFNTARVSEQVYEQFYETSVTGFDLTAVGVLPLGPSFSAFARGGLLFWSADVIADYKDLPDVSRSVSGSGPAFGLGVRYAIGGSFALRAEFALYNIRDVDAGVAAAKPVLVSGEFAF
jgi:hypothetical protein